MYKNVHSPWRGFGRAGGGLGTWARDAKAVRGGGGRKEGRRRGDAMEVSSEVGEVEGRNHAGGAAGAGDESASEEDPGVLLLLVKGEVYLEGASAYQEGEEEEDEEDEEGEGRGYLGAVGGFRGKKIDGDDEKDRMGKVMSFMAG